MQYPPRLTTAQRKLAERHVLLAESLARRRRFEGEDLDDVRSDALWGLIQAARRHDPARGSFYGTAYIAIEGSIRRGRQVRSGVPRPLWEKGQRTPAVSLENIVHEPEGSWAQPGDDLEDAIERLAARNRLIIQLRYWWGLTQYEVADLIGVSQMQVSRLERRSLSELHEALK